MKEFSSSTPVLTKDRCVVSTLRKFKLTLILDLQRSLYLSCVLVLLFFTGLYSTAFAVPPVTAGFPNVSQTAGTLISGIHAPEQGRTAIITYHNGLLYTSPETPDSLTLPAVADDPATPDIDESSPATPSDLQTRVWNISNLLNPTRTILGNAPGMIAAHGSFKVSNLGGPVDYQILGNNDDVDGDWSFIPNGASNNTRTEFAFPPTVANLGQRSATYLPWYILHNWSYNELNSEAIIAREDQVLARWDLLAETGVIGHPFIIGDLLIFASDQSRTGVATYDISDPTHPVLLDVLTTGGPGGYWPELWGNGRGSLYVVFPYRTNGNGMRVVDVTDPSDLKFLADVPLPGSQAMYAQFQDEFAFIGDHKVNMETFESVLDLNAANVVRTVSNPQFDTDPDDDVGLDTSQYALPLGNLLFTGGVGRHQGLAIWAHQAEPDTRGPSVAYHRPLAGQTNYSVNVPITILIHETLESFTIVPGETFIVRPTEGSNVGVQVVGRTTFSFDDILTFTPENPLDANTTYEVIFPEGGIKDAAGNGIEGYSFTFSTGNALNANTPPAINSFTLSASPINPGDSVTLTVTASDAESNPLEYRFDFGDGSSKTAWSSSTSIAHIYPQVGHYKPSVQVRSTNNNAQVSRITTLTVLGSSLIASPSKSSPVQCDATSRNVWLVNPDNNSVSKIHADNLTKDIETTACQDPRSLVQTNNNQLWIACHDDDSIAILNADTGLNISTIDTGYGSAPIAIAVSPDGGTAYVSMEGSGELRRYAIGNQSETGRLPLGPRPHAIAVSGDGNRILVTRFISPKHHAEVWDINASAFSLTGTIEIAKFGGEANRDDTAGGRGVANYLSSIVISPDGQSAWVTATKPNAERGLFFDEDLDTDNTIRTMVVKIDLVTNSFDYAIDLDNSDSASSATFSPLGDYLFVSLQGNNEVMVLDTLIADDVVGFGSLVTKYAVGKAPQGMCVDPTSNRVFVKNFMDRSITVLNASPLFTSGNISLTKSDVNTVTTEALTNTVFTGKQIFYNASDPRMSGEGYISCASCHLDGDSDGRVWDFTGRGEGFRNTIALRGRSGTGHGNVHWSSNFDEIQDFEHDIRNAFGGTGFLTDEQFSTTSEVIGTPKAGLNADLDALAAYVTSLDNSFIPRSPYRNIDSTLTTEAQLGKSVFAAQGCASCHTGAGFTDSTLRNADLHNVGTLRDSSGNRLTKALTGIDTPALQGIWNNAPYFHDGSAATLEDVFVVAGGQHLQAELATPANGARIRTEFTELQVDSTNHKEGLVNFEEVGHRLIFSNVDGGSGGIGALELRYSKETNGRPIEINIVVNDSNQETIILDESGNFAARFTNWITARLENVTLNAGTNNTVIIEYATGVVSDFALDDILITTADSLALAQPHRRVLALSQADQDNLISYLQQLDGSSTNDSDGDGQDDDTDADDDNDTINDDVDNCPFILNTSQNNLDADDLGDACDPDRDGDSVINDLDAYPDDETRNFFDADLDTIRDSLDNCPNDANLNQSDLDKDGEGDTCDTDIDGDSVLNDLDPNETDASITIVTNPVGSLTHLNDEFSDPSSLSNWRRAYETESWSNSQLEQYEVDEQGWLNMMPYTTTWLRDFRGPLAFKEVEGDFIVTTRMQVSNRTKTGPPGLDHNLNAHSGAGIMFRLPHNYYDPTIWQPGYNTLDPEGLVDGESHYTLGIGKTRNCIEEIEGDPNSCYSPRFWSSAGETSDSNTRSNQNLGTGLDPRDLDPRDSTIEIPVACPTDVPCEIEIVAARRGRDMIFFWRQPDGQWEVRHRFLWDRENRTPQNNPPIIQVGMYSYADFGPIFVNRNQAITTTGTEEASVRTINNGPLFAPGVSPDVLARYDYMRFQRTLLPASTDSLSLFDINTIEDNTLLALFIYADADGDGHNNLDELNAGTDPEDANSHPATSGSNADGDNFLDASDNCPAIANNEQEDQDNDGQGDVCDLDRDGDGIENFVDNCPVHSNANQNDDDSDGVGNICDPDWAGLLPINSVSDEFSDSATLNDWQRIYQAEGWVANPLEAWSINGESTQGNMLLMPHSSSWFDNMRGTLAYKEITGDFVATAHLRVYSRHGSADPIANPNAEAPNRLFSLAGIMARNPTGVTQGTPLPYSEAEQPIGSGGSDWQPNGENFVFLSYGSGGNAGTHQYEVKTTTNSDSVLYYDNRGVPAIGSEEIWLQMVRIGETFLVLRRHPNGEWIIENRYNRPDLGDTLQVGTTVYTDWNRVGSFNNNLTSSFNHNYLVVDDASAQPDLVAHFDYLRFQRPDAALTETLLAALNIDSDANGASTASVPLVLLSNTAVDAYLGENANTPYVDTDGDGFYDSDEVVVPNATGENFGDGNGDGIQDNVQAYVTSLKATNNVSWLTFVNTNNGNQSSFATSVAPISTPADNYLKLGLVQYDIATSSGASVTIEVYVDQDAAIQDYLLLGNDGNWVAQNATITETDNKTKLVFTVTEGGNFDRDVTSNGVLQLVQGGIMIRNGLDVWPYAYRFGNVELNSPTLTKDFTVENTGSRTLSITSVSLVGNTPNDFVISNDNCNGQTLAANSTCTIDAAFQPISTGTKSALLQISTDDPDNATASIFLSNNEALEQEAERRLPPVLNSLNIPENMTAGQTYTLSWSVLGYHTDYDTWIVFFDCTGVTENCGSSFGTNFEVSSRISPTVVEDGDWSYKGRQSKVFHYSYDFTPDTDIFDEAKPIVIRFYRKNGKDNFVGNSALSLIIPGNHSDNYYDNTGRRIQKTVSP